MMNDNEIIELVKNFTQGILGSSTRKNKCYMVCLPLASYLSACKVDCELTEGEIRFKGLIYHHYWITLSDGRIIDPTASQFKDPKGKKMPDIWLSERPEWYKDLIPN